jgi:hypothetical protein
LSIDGSSDNEYLALFVGKQLIKDEEQIDTLYILKKIEHINGPQYVKEKTIDMVALGLTEICKKFYFSSKNS